VSTTTVIYSLIGVDGASPAFEAAGASADELDSKFGKLGKAAQVAMLAIAAGAAAVAVESVKSAVTFQASMEKIHTQAGASQSAVDSLTKSVLKMAPSTQQGPQELALALFHLKSVGLDNANAMKALKTASDLAAVGGSNLEDTTNALAGAWRSGVKGAQSFGQTAATVNAIIGAGNMQMTDLVGAFGTGILPAARTFGVSLKSVGAALALMTDEGVPADSAATRLKMSLSLLGAPSLAASKVLGTIGITGLQLANEMRSPQGLVGTIVLLKQHLDASGLSASQQAILLSKAFGGGRSSSAILTMINNLAVLKKKQDQINSSTGAYGPAVAAQRKTAAAQFDLLKSTVDTLGIRLGLDLLPPVTQFAGYLDKTVLPDVQKIAGWLTSPDVKPWTEIAGKLILAAAAATAIYSGLKKAGQLTGISKILEARKTPAVSATTTAAANMTSAGDVMYKASLNMLKAAGMTEDATVGGAGAGAGAGGVTAGDEAAVGIGVAGWLKSAAGGVVIALIAGNIAGMIAKAVHPATKTQVRQYQSAVPGPVQAVSNTLFGGSQNAASVTMPIAGIGIPRPYGAAPKGAGGEPAPGSPGYAAYQAQLAGSRSSPVDRVWSTAYEDFQRNFAGKVTSWFTGSLPHFFTKTIPGKLWSDPYENFQREFAGKITSWFTGSLPHFFDKTIPGKLWSPAYQGFQRDFAGKITSWFTGSLPHFFTKTIPGKLWSPAYQDFQRDFAGKLTSWFTSSLPHFFTSGGSKGAHFFASGFDSGKHWVLTEVDKAKGWVTGQFANAGTWLTSAGKSIVDGLTGGIESKAASLKNEITSLGSRAIGWFASKIKSASPSKVFYQLGTYITTGLALGISATAAKAEKAAASLAAQVTAAYSAGQITSAQEQSLLSRITTKLASDLTSLAKAGASTAAAKLGAAITDRIGSGVTETLPKARAAAKSLMKAINDELAAGKISASQAAQLTLKIQAALTSRKDRIVKALATIGLEMKAALIASLSGATTAAQVKSAVGKLLGYVKAAWSAGAISAPRASALTGWLEKDNTRLQSLATKRAKIAATIATAEKYATTVAGNVASGAQLTSLQSAAGGVIDGAGIVSGLQGQLTAIRQFAHDITRLKAMGLGTALLGQIIDAGPVQGDQLAQALITSGASGIQQANAAQAAITKTANSLGKTAADEMYDSGKQAGKGFLSGLKAQQASITKLMEAIAKSMVATLKKELGIHSPSKITYGIGEFTGIGIEEGLLSRVRHVEGAASRLAVAAVPAPRGSGSGTARAASTAPATGGEFTGNLYLDSGELLGVVRGEIRRHDQKILTMARGGAGLTP
jgi:TP901 family phage tail tape measure protein